MNTTGMSGEKGDGKLKHLISTVKYSGGSVVLCGCFAASGAGALVKIDGIIHCAKYQDNDFKQMSQSIQKLLLGFCHGHISLWILNPVENLFSELKRTFHIHKPKHIKGLVNLTTLYNGLYPC